MFASKARGFTLLELLVVLAIIALIISASLVVYSGVLSKNRDVRRMADVREIQKALALYFIDARFYPIATSPVTLNGSDVISVALQNSGSISKVPSDPSPAYSYSYLSNSTGGAYTISFCLETNTIPNFPQGCGNTVAP